MAIRAAAAAERLAAEHIDVELIDLRSLRPIDLATIAASVRKTHRLLVVHESVKTMGIGAEISAMIAESDVFGALEAPIVRLGGADVPIPYNPALERAAVPQEDDIVAAARRLARQRVR
jgi:pyruvate dehydrogenase E1 component beta subunit